MAVIGLSELQPTGGVTFDPATRLWRREYTRTIRVDTDDPRDGPVIILAVLGHNLGDTYAPSATEFDKYSYLQSASVEPDGEVDDFRRWIVRLSYGPFNALEFPEDPTAQPPEIRGGFAQFERVVDEDLNGDAVVNSAGDPFDPPLMRDDSRPVLTVTLNLPSGGFDPGIANAYHDTINSGAFFGCDPGTVKVMNIGYDRLFHPLIGWYWRVSYEFQYQADGWAKTVLDAGLYQLDSSDKPTPILIKGVPAQEPQLLDGTGKVINVELGDTPNYLDFDVYESKDFSVFNLSRAEHILAGTGT